MSETHQQPQKQVGTPGLEGGKPDNQNNILNKGYRGEDTANLTEPNWDQQAEEAERLNALKKQHPHDALQSLANMNVQASEKNPTSTEITGVASLTDKLRILYPEIDEQQRLQEWVKYQEQQNKLQVFSNDISGVKTALNSEDRPNIIVKRFDKGAARLGFEAERDEYLILERALGERFLPETKFVEIPDATNTDKKYYVLQDRMDGAHYKTATTEAQKRTYASMTEDEIEETYAKHPENWTKFRGKMLREKLTDEQWKKAQEEAKTLYTRVKELEATHRINDLDFFITNDGQIKIIDYQVHDIASYAPDSDGFLEGADEIKVLFDIPDTQ